MFFNLFKLLGCCNCNAFIEEYMEHAVEYKIDHNTPTFHSFHIIKHFHYVYTNIQVAERMRNQQA